jgi:hypothetical protein
MSGLGVTENLVAGLEQGKLSVRAPLTRHRVARPRPRFTPTTLSQYLGRVKGAILFVLQPLELVNNATGTFSSTTRDLLIYNAGPPGQLPTVITPSRSPCDAVVRRPDAAVYTI